MLVPYKITDLASVFDAIDVLSPLAFDTETIGFYGRIRLAQFYQEGWPEVLLVEWPNAMQLAAKLTTCDLIMHNAHYDITTIQQQTDTRWIPKRFEDTFFGARLALPQYEKYSLDEVFVYVLGYDPYKKQRLNKATLQKSKWESIRLSPEQLLYAATDVYYLLDVNAAVCKVYDTPSYILDKKATIRALDMQWNGMPIDFDALIYHGVKLAQDLKALDVPINVNSYKQVREYLGGISESNDVVLAKMASSGNEKAKTVREAKKLSTLLSFINKFERLEKDGRIFGKFKPSARSGRFTSDDQNLQQIPRALKGCFGHSKEANRVLIFSDYAQLELRTICAITNCKAMEQLFRDGADLHGYTAEYLFGPDWTPEHRQLCKTYNFNFLYAGGIAMVLSILVKLAGVVLTEREGIMSRNKWRNLWKEIYFWQQKGIAAWKKGKLGSTPLGRQYKAKLMTDFLNIENQGAGAEVSKLALLYLCERMDANPLYEDCRIVNFIHDSFIIDAPNDPVVYQALAKDLAEAMNEAWFEMSKLFTIKDLPMPVEVKVGFNWGDIEKGKVPNLYEYNLDGYAMLETTQG